MFEWERNEDTEGMGYINNNANTYSAIPGAVTSAGPMPTNMDSETYAQDMNAWITRQQWLDYKNRFLPVEDQLIDQTMGLDLLNERLGAISGVVNTSFDTNMLAAQQRRARYGIQLDNQEIGNRDRNADMERAAAIADGKNNTRTRIYDRNMETIAGGSSAINQAIR